MCLFCTTDVPGEDMEAQEQKEDGTQAERDEDEQGPGGQEGRMLCRRLCEKGGDPVGCLKALRTEPKHKQATPGLGWLFMLSRKVGGHDQGWGHHCGAGRSLHRGISG